MISNVINGFYKYMYYSELKDTKQCEAIIDNFMNLEIDSLKVQDMGAILFAISEYMREYGDTSYLENSFIRLTVDYLCQYWMVEGNYTSALGCIYGGLKGINRFLKQDKISIEIKKMKEYIFKNFIKGGMLTKDKNKSAVTTHMILACVPFGMFEPEDLVFVEYIKEINRLIKTEAKPIENYEEGKLLLAWYYVEQGTYDASRNLLKKSNGNSYLYRLVFEKLEKLGQVDEYAIIHNPHGNNNIYEPGDDERFPKLINSDSKILIKAMAYPMSSHYKVMLSCNGEIYLGKMVDNKFWQFEIGPFKEASIVEYYLFFDKYKDIKTKTYSFKVLKKTSINEIDEYKIQKNTIMLKARDQKQISFKILDDGVLNIEAYNGSDNEGFIKANGDITFTRGEYAVNIEFSPFNFVYLNSSTEIIKSLRDNWLNIMLDEDEIFKIIFRFSKHDEKFYGFGERYNSLNQVGEALDDFVYNQYKNQGLKTYLPIPFFVTSNKYGLAIDNSTYVRYDLGKNENDIFAIEIEDSKSRLSVIPGDIKNIIKKYTDKISKPVMPPKWAFGPWMSSNNWDSNFEVRKQVEMTNKYDIPATVLVIEAWSDEATYYIFNDAKYEEKSGDSYFKYDEFEFPSWGRWPNPKALIEYLHENNLKCILWQIPVIKQITSLKHLQKDADEKYFIESGFGAKTADNEPYRIKEGWFKDSLLVDFTNEDASKWWFDKRKYLIEDLKVDGFKTDGGEFVFGKDIKFSDGRTGREMRNEYPNTYIGAYYNFAKQNNGITFSRAGYRGAQKYPVHWAGDERSTFDAFKRSILAGLSAGISGLPFWGWDLGGFSGEVPSAELFIRSTQMAAFCPIMQYHAESKAELNQDRTPWNISERSKDERVISIYRYFANLRMNMLPYIYNEAIKSSQTGLPMMRALIIDYEDDIITHEIWDEYCFGENMLVAPIIEEGETEREVYFPKGRWFSFLNDEIIEGNTKHKIKADIDRIPVFIKENSIIALNFNESFELGGKISNDITRYNNLCFLIYGDNISKYTFKDDLNNEITIDVYRTDMISLKIQGSKEGINIIFRGNADKARINNTIYELKKLNISDCEMSCVQVK